MSVSYRDTRDIDLFQLARLLAEGGETELASDLERVSKLVSGSTRVAWASDGFRVVGFASALSDSAHHGMVTQLVVHADCQGRGIEAALVDRVLRGASGVAFIMRATSETVPYCAGLGFRPVEGVLVVRRDR